MLIFLNSSNRRANRARSGRSSLRRTWILDLPGDPLQPASEKRPIMDFEQPIGDVNSVVGSILIR